MASSTKERPGGELGARLLDPRDSSLARRGILGDEADDDLRNAGLLRDAVELVLLPLVLEPQHVLGDLELGSHVAADDLLQDDRLAHLPLQVLARHVGRGERGVEFLVRGQVVLPS